MEYDGQILYRRDRFVLYSCFYLTKGTGESYVEIVENERQILDRRDGIWSYSAALVNDFIGGSLNTFIYITRRSNNSNSKMTYFEESKNIFDVAWRITGKIWKVEVRLINERPCIQDETQ